MSDEKAVGVVKSVSGTAKVRGADGEIRDVTAGDPIFEGDTVGSGASTSVVLDFGDGATLQIPGGSDTVIDQNALATAGVTSQFGNVDDKDLGDEEAEDS